MGTLRFEEGCPCGLPAGEPCAAAARPRQTPAPQSVMEVVGVRLSEVVALAGHIKEALWARHLPYVSSLPVELV